MSQIIIQIGKIFVNFIINFIVVYPIPSLNCFSEFLFYFRSFGAIGETFEIFFFPNSSWR